MTEFLAKVRFEGEFKEYVKPVSNIREKRIIDGKEKTPRFKPKDVFDFDRNKIYYAKWECLDKDCDERADEENHHHYYRCYIMCLGEDLEELKERSQSILGKGQRIRIANPRLASGSSSDIARSTEEGEESQGTTPIESDGEQSEVKRHKNDFLEKQKQKKYFTQVSQNMNQTILAARKKNQLIDEQSNGSENDTPTEAQPRALEVADTVPRKVRSIKRKFQKNSVPRHELNIHGDRYKVENGQVYLGLDVYVEENIFLTLERQKKHSIFVRDMAEIIWTPKKLVNRCLDDKKVKVKEISRHSPRRKLEADKRQLLDEICDDRLSKKNIDKAQRRAFIDNIDTILRQKLQDLRSHYSKIKKHRIEQGLIDQENDKYLLDGLSDVE